MSVYVGRKGDKCQAKLKKSKAALKMVARAETLHDLGGDNDTEEKAAGRAGGGKRSGATSEGCYVLDVSEIRLLDRSH